jgi:ABC-type sugar transport system substrate-binding protein
VKKILALVIALVLCLGMIPFAQAEAVKLGVLVPAVTHGWVGGITYNAQQYCKELEAAGKIEYKLYTSSNAEEMTTQIDEAMLWGAQALVIAPQWVGMEVAAQAAING